jgi:hypothetical protein
MARSRDPSAQFAGKIISFPLRSFFADHFAGHHMFDDLPDEAGEYFLEESKAVEAALALSCETNDK